MNLEKIFEIRLLVPPAIFILLLYFLLPVEVTKILEDGSLSWVVSIGGSLAFGFFVSTVTDIFWKWRGRINPECDNYFREIELLKGAYDGSDDAKEIATWKLFDEFGGGVRDQIHKRWSMMYANSNAVVAIILGWFVAIVMFNLPGGYNHLSAPHISIPLISLISIILFAKNGESAYRSVQNMQKIISNYFKSKPPKVNSTQ